MAEGKEPPPLSSGRFLEKASSVRPGNCQDPIKKPLLFGLGVHGQDLFVDRLNSLVIVKVFSQPLPLDPDLIPLTMRAVEAVRRQLAE